MSDFQNLFSSKPITIRDERYPFSNPNSFRGPVGELALGSAPGDPVVFGSFRCQAIHR